MDPVQIINIVQVDDSEKSEYVLNKLAFDDIISKVGKRELSLVWSVSRVGEGNSFILNKIAKYIDNQNKNGYQSDGDEDEANDIEIIADPNEPLTGFEWSTDMNNTTTKGVWFSLPFIVRKSGGQELAIILVDTPGLFNECFTQRDMSTIVGLSLLSSSTLIFNVLNNLTDNELSIMHSFLDYGLQAVQSSPNDQGDVNKPFHDLIFMIRDWARPNPPTEYGLEGGQNFLNTKLEIKPGQKAAARKSREIIRQCFENIQCYLMPRPGDQAFEPTFNGCANQLSADFNAKCNEFCRHVINADNIKVKTVNGQPVTGQEFGQYFQAYVDMFNSDDMPDVCDLVEATNRAADNNLINQLKDDYDRDMANHLRDQPFLDANQLSSHSYKLIDSLETKFSFRKKSTNKSVVQELNGQLSAALEVLYQQKLEANNNRRLTAANDFIGQLIDDFKSELNAHIADAPDIYLTDHTATKIADTKRDHILHKFDHFCGPTGVELFASHKQRLLNQLESEENAFKAHNSQHNRELTDVYDSVVTNAKSEYDQKMNYLFNTPEMFYTDDELDTLNQNIITKLKTDLDQCDLDTDAVPIEPYKTQLDTYIADRYPTYQEKNQFKRDQDKSTIALVMNNLDEQYEDELNEWIKRSASMDVQDFQSYSKSIAGRLIEQNRPTYASRLDFRQLVARFDSTELEMLDVFKEAVDSRRKSEKDLMGRVLNWYNQEVVKEYADRIYIRPDALENIHKALVAQAITKFKHEQSHIVDDRYKELIERNLQTAYKKVQDENDKNAPTTSAIGIDLGTTNSCVAFYKPGRNNTGKIIVCKNIRNSDVTPSCVEFLANDEVVVGDEAKENLQSNPRNTIFSAKRIIGRPYDDPELQQDMLLWPFEVVDDGNNQPVVEVDVDGMSQQYYPEEVSSHVLVRMREIAERDLGHPVVDAVITVPAYFNDAQREATKGAGIMAGLNVLTIINEPTAAALAYQLDRFDSINSRNVLVYDFGGGTFDVSVLKIEMGQMEVLGKGGNNHLGGDDLDNNVIDYCLQDFYAQTGILIDRNSVGGQRALRALRYRCEREKWRLSEQTEATIRVDNIIDNRHLEVTLTRDQFEDLNKDLFKQTIDCVDKVLHEINDGVGLPKDDIDEIILVGGSTNIPYVKTLISEYFNGKRPTNSVNPMQAVAEGAALQAAMLNGNQAQKHGNLIVLDVIPYSLGVRCAGDVMSWIIKAQSRMDGIPRTQVYSTTQDYQTEIEVKVYEGEDQVASHNKPLGNFTITNIKPDELGKQKILVIFHINDEGILKVRAEVLGQKGNVNEIEVKEYKGRLSLEELLMRRRH